MKTIAKYSGLLAAICFAFVGVARAQLVTISDDTGNWTGSVIAFNGTGQSFVSEGEGITGVKALEAVTYTFMSTAPTSATGGTLDASLVLWNGANNGTYTTVQSLGSVTIPPPDTWSGSLSYGATTAVTYQQSFDLSFTNTANLNPSATYMVLLTNTSAGSLSFGLGEDTIGASGPGTQYLNGAEYIKSSGLVGIDAGDWTFSDVSLVPSGNTIPTPEPTTVAAMACALLVGGLVIYRLRQRQGAAGGLVGAS